MSLIRNKRRESLEFGVIAGSGNETIVIPGSEHYTHFSITIPTLNSDQTVTVNGDVSGAIDIGGAASGRLPLSWWGVDNAGSSSVSLTRGRTNMFITSTVLPGGLAVTVANGDSSATSSGFTISVMMSHSSYTASL